MTGEQLPDSPGSRKTALLVVDMISDFKFEDGETLFERTMPIVQSLANLKRRLKSKKVPIVYVNDELGSGRDRLTHDLEELELRSEKAAEILAWIRPEKGDHWIVKPQRSGFYGTPLGSLMLSLGVDSAVVTGVTTDICVLFTAHDAYMRGYSVNVPSDCSTAVELSHHDEALRFLSRVAKADVSPSTSDRWNEFFEKDEAYGESSNGSGSMGANANLALSPALI